MMSQDVNEKVSAPFYVRIVYSQGIRFQFTFSITKTLSSRRTQTLQSSWLDREQVLLRSDPLCRSAKKPERMGKSWLFFGDQHFVTDFLYQTEWQKWLKTGVLTKMDVAFSRDTDEKVYVQHRMLEHSRELYEWLQEGAAVYICGDEKNMAHDVHNTLIEIIEKEGSMSHAEAARLSCRYATTKTLST